MVLKAIETKYKGYRFRSRLEARWAVFFDGIGVAWQYELEGFDLGGVYYLPDFWLETVQMWAEVKAEKFTPEEANRCRRLVEQSRRPCLMLNGPPTLRAYAGYDVHGQVYKSDWLLDSSYLHEHRFFASTACGCSEQTAECPNCLGALEGYRNAYEAARGARFEHGEQPAVQPDRTDAGWRRTGLRTYVASLPTWGPSNPQSPHLHKPFSVGDTVNHPDYGHGTVVDRRDIGGGLSDGSVGTIRVQFRYVRDPIVFVNGSSPLSPVERRGSPWSVADPLGINLSTALPAFSPGDRVVHAKHGEGIVISYKPSGDDAIVEVAFESGAGVKKVMQSFAGLQSVK